MKPVAPTSPPSFEAALQELERLVQTLESGGAPLEASLAAYERGMELLKYCQATLAAAEQKIRLLDDDALREISTTGPKDGPD